MNYCVEALYSICCFIWNILDLNGTLSRALIRNPAVELLCLSLQRHLHIRANNFNCSFSQYFNDTLSYGVFSRNRKPFLVGGIHKLISKIFVYIAHKFRKRIQGMMEKGLTFLKFSL